MKGHRLRHGTFAAVLSLGLLTGAAPADAEQVTIQFFTWGTESVWKPIIDQFMQEHPNIKVEASWATPDYDNKLMSMFAGGVAPDIFWLTYDAIPAWANKGMLYDLTNVAAADREFQSYKQEYLPFLLEGFTWKGNLYGLPNAFNPALLYYNVDIFDQAGVPYPTEALPWDEFASVAKKLTQPDQTWGLAGWNHWTSYVWQNGGDIVDGRGNIKFNSPETIDALQFVQDLRFKHRVDTPKWQDFLAGKAAMALNGGWHLGLATFDPALRWGVGRLPKAEQEATQIFFDGSLMAATTKHPREAWTLIKYVSGPKGQQRLARQTKLTTPVISSVARNTLDRADSRYNALLKRLDQVRYGRLMPALVEKDEVNRILAEEMAPLWNNEASARQVAEKGAARLKTLLGK